MNVEFQCHEKLGENTPAERICGSRFQLPPGNPSNVKCRLHTDSSLIPVEDYGGADFLYVDEGGRTRSQGHIPTPNADTRNMPPQRFHEPDAPTDKVSDEQRYVDLTEEYRRLAGKDPDGRWKLERLEGEVRVLQEHEAKTKKEQAPVY